MNQVSKFYEIIKNEMAVTLATAFNQRVTMRLVSPVYYEGSILIFTAPNSLKYQQLERNPHCCIGAGEFFAEAKAEFLGATMLDANKAFRLAYCEKFPDAFEEGVALGGRSAEFVLLKPTKLKGWTFDDGASNAEGVPTIPFEIDFQVGLNP